MSRVSSIPHSNVLDDDEKKPKVLIGLPNASRSKIFLLFLMTSNFTLGFVLFRDWTNTNPSRSLNCKRAHIDPRKLRYY